MRYTPLFLTFLLACTNSTGVADSEPNPEDSNVTDSPTDSTTETGETGESADTQDTQDTAVTLHERMFLGTGEYDPNQNWHALLRFDGAEELDFPSISDGATPEGVVPIKSCMDSEGVPQNFMHGFFVDEQSDELYFAAIFTPYGSYKGDQSQLLDAGSVGVFSGASGVDGAQTLARRLYGEQTGLSQPHGVWVDRSRDVLYVSNTFGENILVWDNASTVDGNVAPDRIIDYPDLGKPVFIYIDEGTDRMFVASMGGPGPQVHVIANASAADGDVVPVARIIGSETRLMLGNQTTHNLWFDPMTETLMVGHHTHEVLFFDLSDLNWEAADLELNVAPAGVLSIAEESNLSDSADWSAYGIWFDQDDGRLFVSAGHTVGGGGPEAGAQSGHAVKVYANVRDYFGTGSDPIQVEPDRIIRWTNRATYFPPQPVWVSAYAE